MPAVLLFVFQWFTRFLILRAILAFGLFAVSSVTAVNFLNQMSALIQQQASAGGALFAQMATVTGILDAVGIIISAHLVAAGIKSLKFAALSAFVNAPNTTGGGTGGEGGSGGGGSST